MECIITNTLYWFHTISLKTRKTQFLRINGTSPSKPKYSHFDCGLVTSSWGTSNEMGQSLKLVISWDAEGLLEEEGKEG